jgi:pilus assembly protein Flp/PilA
MRLSHSPLQILTISFADQKVFRAMPSPAIGRAHHEDAMLLTFRRMLADEQGATAIEYGLICAGIAMALIAIIQTLGGDLVGLLTQLLNAFP